ncbi:hypothetical protein WDV93_26035 [Pantoea ananatis]
MKPRDSRLSQGEPAELVIPLAEEEGLIYPYKVAYFLQPSITVSVLSRPAGHSPWQRDGDALASVARLIVDKLQHQATELPAPGQRGVLPARDGKPCAYR